MATVTFNGSVSAQAAAGETVTITVTDPSGNKTTLTATTNSTGAFTVAGTYAVAGNYTYSAAIPADADYQAATSTGTFEVTLASRTLTVTVAVT